MEGDLRLNISKTHMPQLATFIISRRTNRSCAEEGEKEAPQKTFVTETIKKYISSGQ